MFKFIEILNNYDEEVAKLREACDRNYEEKEKFRIKNLEGSSIIYNPIGSDLITKTDKNTVYIQGKPRRIEIFHATEIIVLNKDSVDIDWFSLAIEPLLIEKKIKCKYVEEI